jgi:hypothetical protein
MAAHRILYGSLDIWKKSGADSRQPTRFGTLLTLAV